MLRIRNLDAGYGALTVLKGVSLHVDAGEIVAIIGANGAGKSTLLRAISGLVRPQGGRVEFAGRPLCGMAAERIAGLGCLHVPEGRQVFAPMTVRENLLVGGYARPAPRAELDERMDRVFSFFPRLKERRRQAAGTLSGGEQQMLAIGRALMACPSMLMMDEPSMGLAPIAAKSIFEIVARLRSGGLTVLLIEQNARAALRLADRGYVLETGRILLEGAAGDLMANHDVQRAYLGKDYSRIDE